MEKNDVEMDHDIDMVQDLQTNASEKILWRFLHKYTDLQFPENPLLAGRSSRGIKHWKNYDQSKKHKERVAELREAFDEGDEVLEEFKTDTANNEDPEEEVDEEDNVDDGDHEVDGLIDDFADTVEIPEEDDELQSS